MVHEATLLAEAQIGETEQALFQIEREKGDDLHMVDLHLRGVIGQIRFRAAGTQKALQSENAPDDNVEEMAASMLVSWSLALNALRESPETNRRFGAAMALMDEKLAQISKQTRSDSALWAGVISGTTYLALGLLVIACGFLFWGGRTLMAQPLAQTTTTILALSGDETIERIRLSRRSFGFDRLERALEGLRLANIDREDLTRQTMAQREEIRRSLDALAETTMDMQYQARQDALTGLPNRRYTDEYLSRVHQAPNRDMAGSPREFTLMHIDVHRFKEINDTLGHDAGDAILCHVAAILQAHIRDGDRAFRIGGDEFLNFRNASASRDATVKLATTSSTR